MNKKECETGTKYDDEKMKWSLIPFNTLKEVCQVFMFGAKKYKIDNWKYVPDMKRRYYEACLRHLFAWFDGETKDKESGLNHLSHAISCLIFLLWNDNKEQKNIQDNNSILNKKGYKLYKLSEEDIKTYFISSHSITCIDCLQKNNCELLNYEECYKKFRKQYTNKELKIKE